MELPKIKVRNSTAYNAPIPVVETSLAYVPEFETALENDFWIGFCTSVNVRRNVANVEWYQLEESGDYTFYEEGVCVLQRVLHTGFSLTAKSRLLENDRRVIMHNLAKYKASFVK